jgi:hypothetical protein
VTTAAVLVVLLHTLGALGAVSRGLLVAAAICGGTAVVCFGAPSLGLGRLPAAVVGLVLYVAALGLWRPSGLRASWAYLRHLGAAGR